MTPRSRVFVCLLCVALVAMVFRNHPLNNRAQAYAQTVAATAGATYVTLRTLNAFLSTAQELEVGLTFIASGTAQPLKVLEPVDDTVERVADLIFGIMVVAGVIAVSLGPISVVGWGLVAGAMGYALLRQTSPPPQVLNYGLFWGAGLPLALILSSWLAVFLTEDVYQAALVTLESITNLVGDADTIEDDAPGISEYRALASTVWSRADELVSTLITLASIFVFRIFVMPFFLVGGILLALRRRYG